MPRCCEEQEVSRAPLRPLEREHSRSGIHTAACGGPHAVADGCSWRNCSLWRVHAGTGLSWRMAACGKDHSGAGEERGKEGTVERSCYGVRGFFCLCFSPCNTILIGNKWNYFFPSQMTFFFSKPMTVTVKWSHCPYLNPWDIQSCFLSPSPV